MNDEAAFRRRVIAYARGLGHLVHYCRDMRHCDGRGLPDLLVASPLAVLWAELKMPYGETSAQQDLWAWTLTAAGERYRLWTPDHWDRGAIQRELRAMVPPHAALPQEVALTRNVGAQALLILRQMKQQERKPFDLATVNRNGSTSPYDLVTEVAQAR